MIDSVSTEYGDVEGIWISSNNGVYLAFKGIPYAKPPIGDLRFKAPQPPQPWKGKLRAKEHMPVCPQYNERLDRMEVGSEDCLFLNIFTTSVEKQDQLKPVMVWIHGGGFYTGSGDSDFYGPEYFMTQNVILVTFNYRLEVLGFLCLDNEEVPGNAGLKDQVAALQWVKRNIEFFGGNPNNITIFGCSAGSGSVSLHLLSKMSEGLFNKAICQSGVCLSEWCYNPSTVGSQKAFLLGKMLDKETDDVDELLDFLRKVPTKDLVNIKLTEYPFTDLADSIVFGPVIEKSCLKVEKFISEPPPDLIRKGKMANIPLILGYTSGEGIEVAKHFPGKLNSLFFNSIGAVVPRELKNKLPPEKIMDVDQMIRKFYFKGREISTETIDELVNLETDTVFAYNIQRFARYHSLFNSEPVYLYKFVADSERNVVKKVYKMEALKGVCHADELHYQFNVTCYNVPATDESRNIIQGFVQLWTNFAKSGNPTVTTSSVNENEPWRPFTEDSQYCYIIGTSFKCGKDEDRNRMKFWEEIYGEQSLVNLHDGCLKSGSIN